MNKLKVQYVIYDWLMRRSRSRTTYQIDALGIAIGSHTGLVRKDNQDKTAVLRITSGMSKSSVIGVLCDGMGGMDDGAACASLSTATFLSSCLTGSHLPVHERLVQAAEEANSAVYRKYRGRGGATLSAFIDDGDQITAINIGDSRIYSISETSITQISTDDTLIAQGFGEANLSPVGSDLLQYVGVGHDIVPHVLSVNKAEGRSLLLVSDGIHFLGKETLLSLVKNAPDAGTAVRRLIELSLWWGGKDNSSAILLSDSRTLRDRVYAGNPELIELWDAAGEFSLFFRDDFNTQPATFSARKSSTSKYKDKQSDNKLGEAGKKDDLEATSKNQKKEKRPSVEIESDTEVEPQMKIEFE